MASEHLWVAPGEIVTDISGYVQVATNGKDGFRVASNAEEGSHGSAEVPFDDPDGTFPVIGLNAYRIRETLSEAADPYIFAGSFTERTEERGPYRTGVSRIVNATIVDLNYGLSKYVIRPGEDGDRPAETEAARMTWLLGTTAMDFLAADTSLIDTGSTMLPAANFEEYTPQQVLDSMAQRMAKNYFVYWDGEAEDEVLVYAADSGTHLTSALRFSNVETDVDDTTTFLAGLDWQLKRDPSRIASTVFVRGANGIEGETDDDTAAEFSRVDRVMDGNWIKTSADLTAQAIAYLADLDSEELTLSGTVYLPAEKASQFRAGMRCQMRAIHLTGLSEFVYVRLLNVTVVNISEDPTLTYALAFEGTFSTVTSFSCAGAIVAIDTADSGTNTGGVTSGVGSAITGTDGDFITIGLTVLSQPHTCIGDQITVGGSFTFLEGWETLDTADCNHTMAAMYYRSNAAGTPVTAWSGNNANSWRQIALVIPGGWTVVQSAAQIATGDSITLDDPATEGNLLILGRVAQGPSGFGSDPDFDTPTWSFLVGFTSTHPSEASPDADLWALCVPAAYGDTINSGDAGSFHLAFAVELAPA